MADALRRGFLRNLVSLPLIGGGVTLIGQPTAAAVPVTEALLDSYDAWLHFERRYLEFERFGEVRRNYVNTDNPGGRFHGNPHEGPQPASRAAIVLAAAGCSWREGGR